MHAKDECGKRYWKNHLEFLRLVSLELHVNQSPLKREAACEKHSRTLFPTFYSQTPFICKARGEERALDTGAFVERSRQSW